MKAGPVVVGQLLQLRARYKVPIYQRNYVWTKARQWEPFWADVRSKATERLAGRDQRFSHYMGAIVLESRGGYSSRVVSVSQVVDGQQRLTTFQLFLAAARDYAQQAGYESAQQNIERYLLNPEVHLMDDPDVEIFKVWPTEQNRDLFRTIVREGRGQLRAKYPTYFYVSRDKIYDYATTPRMLAAYGYFYDRIRDAVEKDELQEELIEPDPGETIVEGDDAESDGSIAKELKFDALWRSLVEEFKVVEILLEEGDDAQVIFETLNERGEPLLAADLVRNNIFHRAEEEDQRHAERLFNQYWSGFEDRFWMLEEKQGRYKKQRIEFFLANYIAAQIAADVTITKLFSEYKAFLKRAKFGNVEAELSELARYGAIYRTLVERKDDTPLGLFSARLEAWDVTTVFPLAMQLWSQTALEESEKAKMLDILLSFIIRRAVCGLTPKNYNRLFLAAVADLNQRGWGPGNLSTFLLRQSGDSGRWPRDEEFRREWLSRETYVQLGSARTRAVLEELEKVKRSRFQESDALRPGLTVEHILPDSWRSHWPLAGEVTPTAEQVLQAQWSINEDESIVGQIVRRDRLKQTLGNLTLLTRPLNAKQQHFRWEDKRALLQDLKYGSVLVMNREVAALDVWDEAAIEKRGVSLFELAKTIWAFSQAPLD